MSMSFTATDLPVAGIPMNSPLCVPVTCSLATALSPLAITSSTTMLRSGNAAFNTRK